MANRPEDVYSAPQETSGVEDLAWLAVCLVVRAVPTRSQSAEVSQIHFKRKGTPMRIRRLSTTAIVVAILLMNGGLAAAQSSSASGVDQTDGWKTIVYPIHAWLPVFGADVTLPGQSTPPGSGGGSGGITLPSAKTSGNFDGAALAGFRVERSRLSIEGEFLWAGMSGSVEAPRFDLTLDTIAARLMGGFKVAPALYIDGGVRRFALDINASILNFQPVNWKPGIWEPVVGTTFRPNLGKQLRLFTQADVGFSTDGSSRSGSASASVEWKPISHLSLGAGWGWIYLRVDGTIGSFLTRDIHLSQTLNGPMLTLGIPF